MQPYADPNATPRDRRVPEGDESVREVRISCPDATGLGCDIARMLLDFGLRILTGDLSTDGTWCYLVFVVSGCTPRVHCWRVHCWLCGHCNLLQLIMLGCVCTSSRQPRTLSCARSNWVVRLHRNWDTLLHVPCGSPMPCLLCAGEAHARPAGALGLT